MSPKKPSPEEIAFWRYEQIEEALPEQLGREARSMLLKRRSRTPVLWPSGVSRRISLPTLYRWMELFRQQQLKGLEPKRRSDVGVARAELPDEVVVEAISLLTVDPGMTYTFLLALLRPKFEDVTIARSTLQRRLSARPEYARIKRAMRHRRRRTRFVAKKQHDIWHTDGKGPIKVVLKSGKELRFHILSILDDASRAVLAAICTLRADLAAAVTVFLLAALRWGLPAHMYADRASIFDSKAFRMGLAQLGSHRVQMRPRNPEANGKIEAYHRTIDMWFVQRLPVQQVVELIHLQELLDGVLYGLYQTHKHRSLGTTPEAALAGFVSTRIVPPSRLVDAFRQQRRLKTHRKTGEVDIGGTTYLVADELRGQRLTFLVDLRNEAPPLVVHPMSGAHLSVRRAAVKPQDVQEAQSHDRRWGNGPLQALYDNWRGHKRPLAEPGFGLPELYELLGQACGRYVPQSDAEAALIQQVYSDIGPLPQKATRKAIVRICQEFGHARPLKTYLDALKQAVVTESQRHRS